MSQQACCRQKRQSVPRVETFQTSKLYKPLYAPYCFYLNRYLQVETAQKYLDNGAQPTPRVVKLLKDAGVKLPKWVKEHDATRQKSIKNQEKLRKNQPKEEPETAADEASEQASAE